MNARRPKVWQTEDSILAAIDRTKRMAQAKLRKSIVLAEKVKAKMGRCEELRFELMKPMSEYQRESLEGRLRSAEVDAGKAQEVADAYAAAYHRAINATLPRLGGILAAFRTQTFPEVLGAYRGVALK